MQLIDILSKKSVRLNVKVDSKNELFDELLLLASLSGKIKNYTLAKESIYHRESLMVTGLGRGVALPHSKSDAVTHITASLLTLSKPLDYDSFDNIPINIALMILSPNENPELHLALIGSIAKFFQNDSNRLKLLRATYVEDVFRILNTKSTRK